MIVIRDPTETPSGCRRDTSQKLRVVSSAYFSHPRRIKGWRILSLSVRSPRRWDSVVRCSTHRLRQTPARWRFCARCAAVEAGCRPRRPKSTSGQGNLLIQKTNLTQRFGCERSPKATPCRSDVALLLCTIPSQLLGKTERSLRQLLYPFSSCACAEGPSFEKRRANTSIAGTLQGGPEQQHRFQSTVPARLSSCIAFCRGSRETS